MVNQRTLNSRMERLASLLPSVLDRVARNEETALIFLIELWTDMVGEKLAARTRPKALRKQRLTVDVPSEIWKKELESLRHSLSDAVNRYWGLPLVREVQLQVCGELDRTQEGTPDEGSPHQA